MKKLTSLLLALVMALSLCATAFAGSAAETAVLRLTGDAADEVVNLKDGQRVNADRDVAVRLNVQSDPTAAEYTVALDGQTVEVDHSTSQYHFYYLPAAQLSGVSTLSVSTQADVGADAVSIATADELKAFRDRVNSSETTLNAILTADITLDKSETWTPIGNGSSVMYAGTFDGDGHTISGLSVTGTNSGLFGYTGDATIQNLTISDSTIVFGNDYTNNCGTFVGLVKGSTTLINCHTTNTVTISGGVIGGLVGAGSDSASAVLAMERCSNAATVNGNATTIRGGVGGLVGLLYNGATIKDCFNTGTVTNKSASDSAAVGGLIGSVYNGSTYKNSLSLTNVYNTGAVSAGSSGTSYAGGLVGNSTWGFNITNAYGTVTVKVGDAYGGIIVGTVQNDAYITVENVYVEVVSGQTSNIHAYLRGTNKMKALDDNGHRLFASEMKDPSNLLAKLGAGFAEDTETINNGYPVLAWQNAAAASGAVELTVTAGSQTQKVQLPTDDSTDPTNPTKVEVAFDNPGENAVMDRIYFTDLPEGVSLGTTMSNTGVLSDELTKLDAGYTGEQLFFYKTPKALSASVKAVWTDGDGEKHYYTITITRAAQSGLALGPSSTSVYDASPREAGASNKYNDDGFLKTPVAFGPYRYDAQNAYTDGAIQNGKVAVPNWDDMKAKSNGLYFFGESGNAFFARVGRYWLPISYTEGDTTIESYTPFYVRLGYDTTFKYYTDKADALNKDNMPSEAKEMLENSLGVVNTALSTGNNYLNSAFMELNAKNEFVLAGAEDSVGISGRDFFGYKPYAESLYEKDINAIMDLTAIFSGDDAALANYQWQAYQKIMTMQGGIHRFIDIQSLADRDTYQNIRQAKWDLLQTTDLAGVNAILTGLKLDTISAEPAVMLGDINGDGEVTIIDAGLIVQHVNNIKALSEAQLAAADVNNDGAITIIDAGIVVQYVNKIRSSLN